MEILTMEVYNYCNTTLSGELAAAPCYRKCSIPKSLELCRTDRGFAKRVMQLFNTFTHNLAMK
jgi:hypothetical protein